MAAILLVVDPLWNMGWAPEKSSPEYGKLSNTCISICCVGVYIAELSGLLDLPVTSELADDIWYDIWDILGYILVDRL